MCTWQQLLSLASVSSRPVHPGFGLPPVLLRGTLYALGPSGNSRRDSHHVKDCHMTVYGMTG